MIAIKDTEAARDAFFSAMFRRNISYLPPGNGVFDVRNECRCTRTMLRAALDVLYVEAGCAGHTGGEG